MDATLLKTGVFVIVICLICGCSTNENESSAGEEKIGVVVSILPQAEFVEKIGGDKVKVTVMIPPGASPHTYEPKPSQLVELSKAKMYAKVGSGIEFELSWMDKIISMNRDMLVVDCSIGITLIESEDADEPGKDVHIWTSVRNAEIMAENICEGLIKADPKNREYYDSKKNKYLKELDELDKEITGIISEKKNKEFIVYHPAFAYFSRDYGLKQIPVEQEGKEPAPRWIERLIEEAKEKNITVIFASPQLSTKSAEVIANEIKGSVVLIDPLEKNYTGNMIKIAEAFAKS